MQFKFIGVPGESHESLHMYGLHFPLGEAVPVADAKHAGKLANHPHFATVIETKAYDDGATATGPAPLPEESPAETPKRRRQTKA